MTIKDHYQYQTRIKQLEQQLVELQVRCQTLPPAQHGVVHKVRPGVWAEGNKKNTETAVIIKKS
jgi:hypothetical protein